jgi:uncharacterized membrane protein (UPF0127 family)
MNVTIGGKMFPGEYLTNPEDIQKGMMGRDSLEGCMVFKMGKGHHSFWMKNCLIPLDIVFVLNNNLKVYFYFVCKTFIGVVLNT